MAVVQARRVVVIVEEDDEVGAAVLGHRSLAAGGDVQSLRGIHIVDGGDPVAPFQTAVFIVDAMSLRDTLALYGPPGV